MKKNVLGIAIGLLNCLFIITLNAQTWQELGPFGILQNNETPSRRCGLGQIYAVTTHPTIPGTLYVGTPGGIWKTVNEGNDWEPFATGKEFQHTTAVGNIVVDRTDDNIIYISTGSKGRSRVIYFSPEQPTSGIYRCQISGTTKTWTDISSGLPSTSACYRCADAPTAPLSSVSSIYREIGYRIHTLTQSPLDDNVLYAGTNFGLYVCNNVKSATPTWQQITGIPAKSVQSIEFTKNSTSSSYRCYVTGDNIAYMSTDLMNWTNLIGSSPGLDLTAQNYLTNLGGASSVVFFTMQTTVSHKYPDQMYMGMRIVGDNNKSYRYFLKHNGINWQLLHSTTSDFFGILTSYDPVITAVFPNTAPYYERIAMGFEFLEGITENGSGGYKYFKNSSGYNTNTSLYSHGDIMDVCTSIDNQYIYCANDGMLSKFNPLLSGKSAWLPVDNNGISLLKSWSLNTYDETSSVVACGAYDNGIFMSKPESGWRATDQGFDGIDVVFTKDNALIYTCNGPEIRRSIAPAYNEFDMIGSGVTTWGWTGRLIYKNPKNSSVLYRLNGYCLDGIYKITNGAINIQTRVSHNIATRLAISPADTNTVYLGRIPCYNESADSPSRLYLTTTGIQLSSTFIDQTSTLPSANQIKGDWLKHIVVGDLDPATVFIGYEAGYDPSAEGTRARIYKSIDYGVTWSDYNNSQGTIPGRYRIHCMLYEKGSNDGIYVGTDNGIYYTNRTMNSWIRYDQGLPNIPVTEIIYHPTDNKILISTWGRGIWKVDPYCPAVGDITINSTTISTYHNKPVQANGTITYNANTHSNNPARRVELRSTKKINIEPGAYYIPHNNSYTFDAFITPCSGASSYRMEHTFNYATQASESILSEADLTDELKKEEITMKIYPNPTSDGRITLFIGNYTNTKLHIQLINISGEVCYESTKESAEPKIELNFGQKPLGVYILKVIKENNELFTTRVSISATNIGSPKKIQYELLKK